MSNVGKDAKAKATRIVHDRVDAVLRAASMEATRRITMRTPVDTGRARANWNGSIDSPDDTVVEGATVADVGGKLAENLDVAAKTKFADGEKFYLANNLPYAEVLENGSSQQAPAGMVDLTMAELRPLVETLAKQEARDGE